MTIYALLSSSSLLVTVEGQRGGRLSLGSLLPFTEVKDEEISLFPLVVFGFTGSNQVNLSGSKSLTEIYIRTATAEKLLKSQRRKFLFMLGFFFVK